VSICRRDRQTDERTPDRYITLGHIIIVFRVHFCVYYILKAAVSEPSEVLDGFAALVYIVHHAFCEQIKYKK